MYIDTLNAIKIDRDKVRSRHVGAFGMTGSGKTNAIFVWLEEEIAAGGLVTVIDSEGDFYPLKACGLLVIGKGRKGNPVDIEVSPTEAIRMAEIVASHRVSVIVDLSGYPIAQRDAFVTAYLGRLWELYQDDDLPPMRVVIDEIQLFAPQGPRTESKLLIQDIAARGRKRYFTLMVATQRPQSVDKTVLDACAVRIFLKVELGKTLDAVRDLLPGEMQKKAETVLPTFLPGQAVLKLEAESHIVQIRESQTFQQRNVPLFIAIASTTNEETIKALAAALKADQPDLPMASTSDAEVVILREENQRLRSLVAQLEKDNRDLLDERGDLLRRLNAKPAPVAPDPVAASKQDWPHLSELALQRRVNSQQRAFDSLIGALRGLQPASCRMLKELVIQDREQTARQLAMLSNLSEATMRTSRTYMPLVTLGLIEHRGSGVFVPKLRIYLMEHCANLDHDVLIDGLIKAI